MANEQKRPLTSSLQLIAQRHALMEVQKRGHGLPGHVVSVTGSIVTVSFEVSEVLLPQVIMPIFGPEYIRYPVQIGDKGVAFSIPVYMGNVSGLGPNVPAQLDGVQGNLTSLVWVPCGNKSWSAPDDPDAVCVYGPNGFIARDSNSKTVFKVTPTGLEVTSGSGTISFTAGGHTVAISSSGVVIDGVTFATHEHGPGTYVAGDTPVTGDSGQVVPDS